MKLLQDSKIIEDRIAQDKYEKEKSCIKASPQKPNEKDKTIREAKEQADQNELKAKEEAQQQKQKELELTQKKSEQTSGNTNAIVSPNELATNLVEDDDSDIDEI